MRTTVVLATLSLTAAALGQETGPAPMPVFRSTIRLVEVSVVVTGADSRPVLGLTKDDFQVMAGGQSRPVAFAQFDGLAGVKRELQPLPKYVFTNRAEYLPGEARSVTAIVIDSLNSSQSGDVRTRAHVIDYLKKMPPGSRVALYHLGQRLRVIHDFTGDTAELQRLVAALQSRRLPGAQEDTQTLQADADALLGLMNKDAGKWQESMDRMLQAERFQADRIRADRMEMAFASMMALARHLAPMPGRKNLVWAGGGMPLLQVTGVLAPGPGNEVRSFEDRILETSRRLAQANVVLYYYDTRGVVAPSQSASAQFYRAQTEAERISQDAIIGTTLLAKRTGGRYINYSNDFASAMEAAEADQRASYTLGFYAGEEDKEWVPLAVKVKRAGAKVSHREGYGGVVEPGIGTAGPWTDDALRAALASPVGAASILMNARCEPDPEATAPAAVRLFVQIDAETLTLLPAAEGKERRGAIDITVAEITRDGKIYPHRESAKLNVREQDWTRTLREGVPYVRRWVPRMEASRIRVLVHDATSGQTGVLDIPMGETRR